MNWRKRYPIHRLGWRGYWWFVVVFCRFMRHPYPFRRVRDLPSIIGVAWAAMWYLPDEEEENPREKP